MEVGVSSEQQMESDIPASCVQGVVLVAGARLGTLLRPKYPTARQRAQYPLSLLQQMEYRWLERWNELLSWTVIFNIFVCEADL